MGNLRLSHQGRRVKQSNLVRLSCCAKLWPLGGWRVINSSLCKDQFTWPLCFSTFAPSALAFSVSALGVNLADFPRSLPVEKKASRFI